MNNQFNSNRSGNPNKKYPMDLARKRNIWNTISRIAAFFVSIAVWWVSINFSVDGFKFEQPGKEWIGWVLGLSITVIEIVFNKPGIRRNLTLWTIGAMAYAYGMWTNVVGIYISGNGHGGWIWAGLLGAVLEWIPEVLFVWAILGVVTKEGDFIGNIIKMFTGKEDDDEVEEPQNNDNGKHSNNRSYPPRPPITKPYRPMPNNIDEEIDRVSNNWADQRYPERNIRPMPQRSNPNHSNGRNQPRG